VDARFQHIAHGVLHDEIPSMIWVGTHAPSKSCRTPAKHPVIPVRALRCLVRRQAGSAAGLLGRFRTPLLRISLRSL